MQRVCKVRSSDIVAYCLPLETISYGEVGPGRKRDNHVVWFEVYPIERQPGGIYAYRTEPEWVDHTRICKHFSVRKAEDFHMAWISLEFKPIVSENDVVFEPLFEDLSNNNTTPLFDSMENLFEEDDDDASLRSVDSYSTDESDYETDSFIAESEQHESDQYCECEYCDTTKQSVKWFDRDWKPTDETEIKVKTFIEYLEQKYTV